MSQQAPKHGQIQASLRVQISVYKAEQLRLSPPQFLPYSDLREVQYPQPHFEPTFTIVAAAPLLMEWEEMEAHLLCMLVTTWFLSAEEVEVAQSILIVVAML